MVSFACVFQIINLHTYHYIHTANRINSFLVCTKNLCTISIRLHDPCFSGLYVMLFVIRFYVCKSMALPHLSEVNG